MPRLVGGRHALSSIVGGTIFIFILLIGFGLVAWNNSIYDSYVQDINSRELLYQRQVSENVAVTGVKFNQNKLNLTITNFSPITVRIVRVWVTNVSATPPSPPWHKSFDVNYHLTPGRSISNVAQNLGTFKSANLYAIKLVTERGTIFGATSFSQTSIVGIAQGMGWLAIDWESYVYRDNANLAWRKAWSINGTGNKLEFNITLINHWDRDLTLLKYTYLRLEIDSGSTGNVYPYYVMDPGNTPISPVCYTQTDGSKIVVPYNRTGDFKTGGKPTQVPFMDVTYYNGGQCNVPSNTPQASHYYSVYIVVYYTYDFGGKTYVQAQTIPFEGSGVQ